MKKQTWLNKYEYYNTQVKNDKIETNCSKGERHKHHLLTEPCLFTKSRSPISLMKDKIKSILYCEIDFPLLL